MYLAILSLLYCPCLYGLCCYALYRKAQTVIQGPTVSGGVEVQKKETVPPPLNSTNIQNVQNAQAPAQPTVNVTNNASQPVAPVEINIPGRA